MCCYVQVTWIHILLNKESKSCYFHCEEYTSQIRGKVFLLTKLSVVPCNSIPFQQKTKIIRKKLETLHVL